MPPTPFPPPPDGAEEPTTPPRKDDVPHTLPTPPSEEATLPPPLSRTGLLAASGVALPEVFGRYRIEKKLGEGGMGAVWLAHDTQLDRPVALKVPFLQDDEGGTVRARFLQEARAAAALHHPNICPIHDLGEIDGVPYLTMAFIRGEPLSRRVAAGPLPPRDAAALVHKVALALQAAHDRGVIHRDLKPGNILLDERGEPVVMDFGLARRGDAVSALTKQGQVMGTPAYMAPEQLGGDARAMGPATDVYSLGVVLFELLTGAPPFRGDLLALVSQVALDAPPPPSARRPGIDPRLDAICLRAMAKKPHDRFASMRDLASALADFLHGPTPGIAAPPRYTGARPDGPVLALRVEGTPYLYRPTPGQDVISVGRQKRAPGDPPDHGNDFVLRVAGDDQLSARISRRHFEIRRSGADYAVVDLSKAGLLLNGAPVPKNTPMPLKAGDKLVVAGVVTLEVLLQQDVGGATVAAFAQAPPARGAGRVVFEASVGDVMTVE